MSSSALRRSLLPIERPQPMTKQAESEAPGAHPSHAKLRSLFVGRDGLRAGWACLIFLLILASCGALLNFLARQLLHPHARPRGTAIAPALMITAELISATLVLLVTWLMARLEHRPFGRFGLGDRALLARFSGGLAVGFAAISALVGALWADHLLVLHGPVLHGSRAAGYGFAWGLGFLLTGIFEETLLRGYLLFTLARGIGFPASALLLSFAFGLVHGNNPGETPVGLFAAAAVGLLFCFSIWRTGSLWWAIGFHAAWDWGESFFWSTSDSGTVVQGHLFDEHPAGPTLWSGGATGPEGSLLVFPVLLLCALAVSLWWRNKRPAGLLPSSLPNSLPHSLPPEA